MSFTMKNSYCTIDDNITITLLVQYLYVNIFKLRLKRKPRRHHKKNTVEKRVEIFCRMYGTSKL
jgi:hypothetical protein